MKIKNREADADAGRRDNLLSEGFGRERRENASSEPERWVVEEGRVEVGGAGRGNDVVVLLEGRLGVLMEDGEEGRRTELRNEFDDDGSDKGVGLSLESTILNWSIESRDQKAKRVSRLVSSKSEEADASRLTDAYDFSRFSRQFYSTQRSSHHLRDLLPQRSSEASASQRRFHVSRRPRGSAVPRVDLRVHCQTRPFSHVDADDSSVPRQRPVVVNERGPRE